MTAIFKITDLPIADKLNTSSEDISETLSLTLLLCNDCNLVFLKELVEPEILFPQNYPYFTSVSSVLTKHCNDLATSIITTYGLNNNSLVIDIGSNDGTSLKVFVDKQINVLGIDPTTRPVLKAILNGVPTLRAFWNSETSQIVAQELNRSADIVLCSNVISHVNNPSEFVQSLNCICNNETTIIAEFPYLKSIIEKRAFDIIFHQHISYFTIASFERLIQPNGFYVNDAEVLQVHGGNLRVYFSKNRKTSLRLNNLKQEEQQASLYDIDTLKNFSDQIANLKLSAITLLEELRNEGAKIMGYGAAGKATTLVKYFELDKTKLSGIVDKNKFKQNKYFPAYNHKIHSSAILKDPNNKPDYLLLLAWTLKNEIIAELSDFQQQGGKFIVILPKLEII